MLHRFFKNLHPKWDIFRYNELTTLVSSFRRHGLRRFATATGSGAGERLAGLAFWWLHLWAFRFGRWSSRRWGEMGNGNQTKDESEKLLSRRTWARLWKKSICEFARNILIPNWPLMEVFWWIERGSQQDCSPPWPTCSTRNVVRWDDEIHPGFKSKCSTRRKHGKSHAKHMQIDLEWLYFSNLQSLILPMNNLKSPVSQHLFLANKTEALQALAVVLRGAHDDSHPFAAQCQGFPGSFVGKYCNFQRQFSEHPNDFCVPAMLGIPL